MWQTYMFLICVPSLLFLILSRYVLTKTSTEGRYEISSKFVIIIVSLLASASYFLTVSILGSLFYDLTCVGSSCREGFYGIILFYEIIPFATASAILCLPATLLYLSKRPFIVSYVVILLFILLFPALAVISSKLYHSSKYDFADIPILSPNTHDSEIISQDTFYSLENSSSLKSSSMKRVYRDFNERQYVPFNPSFVVGIDTYSFIYNDNNKFVIPPPDPDLSGKNLILIKNIGGLGKISPLIFFTSTRTHLPDVFLTNDKKMLLVEPASDGKVDFIIFDPESNNQIGTWHSIDLADTNGFNPFFDDSIGTFLINDKYIIFGGFFTKTSSVFRFDLDTNKTTLIINIKIPKACIIDKFFVSGNKIIWTEIPNKSINDSYTFKCYSYAHDM